MRLVIDSCHDSAPQPQGVVLGSSGEDYVGPAQNFARLCDAFRLVHDNYVSLGYMPPHPTGMRYSIYELLPSSMTFTVVEGGSVVGTLTTVLDSMSGVPLCSVFSDRIEELRADGATIAECTMFACAQGCSSKQPYLALMQYAFNWCCIYGVTDLCVVVNPCHRRFWEDLVGFELVAEPRNCGHVSNAPGFMLRLDIRGLLRGTKAPRRYMQRIMSVKTDPRRYIDSYSPDDYEMAALLRWQPQIGQGMTRYQRAVMERYYGEAVDPGAGVETLSA